MNYPQCLRYLEQIQKLGIKFGLDNVRAILASMGNPHQRYPSVLVAGTNGKGSVCAMLTRILTLHGYRAGLYTSPHLVKVEERIRIGEALVSRSRFASLLTRLREKIEQLISGRTLISPPTYFEMLTCLAFLYFEEERVDMAVLEVGMGGRFDATNVARPLVSVITTISPEHQKYLGETLKQIGFEKAGIIKPGVPVVCGETKREAVTAIRRRARELAALFIPVFSRQGRLTDERHGMGRRFTYRSDEGTYAYTPSLLGVHQGRNAAVAIMAAETLSGLWNPLDKAKIIAGIETARWAGRTEQVSREPFVLLDGAHNEEGAAALRLVILEEVPKPRILVFAAMQDKKIERLAEILFPLAERVILTRFPYYKAADPGEIQNRTARFADRLMLEPDPRKAVQTALNLAGRKGAVVVTGSLFLVGEMKKIWE